MKHFQTMQIHTLNRASILYSWSSIIFSICFCSFCKNNLTQRSEHNFTTPLTKRNSPMPPFTAAKSSASHRNGGDELVLRHFDPQPYEKKKHITIWDCVQFGILQVRSIGKCFWVQRNFTPRQRFQVSGTGNGWTQEKGCSFKWCCLLPHFAHFRWPRDEYFCIRS